MKRFLCLLMLITFAVGLAPAQPKTTPEYVKKSSRRETITATLQAFGLPTLEGKWYSAGPFDNPDRKGIDIAYPPEKGFDINAQFKGKADRAFGWTEYKTFRLGEILDLKKLIPTDNISAVVYLYHEFECKEAGRLPLSLGSDDTMTVWFNGDQLLKEDHERPAAPDQMITQLKLKPGKNTLLLKICQYAGGWEAYVSAELPDTLPAKVQQQFRKDFPAGNGGGGATTVVASGSEAKHYVIDTFSTPKDCLLEVGGLAFRPDGKLLVCTRRGEIWLIENPTTKNPSEAVFKKFASGLHEALGLWIEDDKTVYVTQRPELTKVIDSNGDGVADSFETICDRWGVSGDYHEYAFGPVRDKEGNFYVTLNVGFGGGHQAKVPWRGWCMKISPSGAMEPYAYGLRSPNGIAISPEGDIFYTDNQGEWAASNKIHQIKKGEFYGHQASLKWLKDSPFANNSDKVPSGMLYDGQAGRSGAKGFPQLTPPCIWLPYSRMGQSISGPTWDTTKGKFGPFEGQMFVGDQNKANVMRVAMEKVNGLYQGACFPFRSGFQSGVNRVLFGPDGALYVGQTNRGWGSLGGKSEGLQRLTFTGEIPLEVHHIHLTAKGFEFTFTKPVDPKSFAVKNAVVSKSFTYVYHPGYGCPETDTRPEPVENVRLSADGKTLSVDIADIRPGRVYDFRLNDVKTPDGLALLHSDAYYTVNQLVK